MELSKAFREGTQVRELRVANLDCDSDAAKIERGLQTARGIETLRVYPKAAKVVGFGHENSAFVVGSGFRRLCA